MIRPELEALLQGALDDTLTPEERDRLARTISENRAVRERGAELEQLTSLIDSLGPADAPPGLIDNVLAQVSHRPHTVRPSTFQRGVTVNKRILFGLAAAAAVVLAVITYNSNPPATEGTEATIGAAQRAQAPQIAPSDVKLGDTSSQDVLQTELWDQLAKDEDLRTLLTDASFRAQLTDLELRKALGDEAMLRALKSPDLKKLLEDQAIVRNLDNAEAAKKFNDASLRQLVSNRAMGNALKNTAVRAQLLKTGAAAAMLRPAFQNWMRSKGVDAALRSEAFARHMARGARIQ